MRHSRPHTRSRRHGARPRADGPVEGRRSVWPSAVVVVVFLLSAAILGVGLRLMLAGWVQLPGAFAHLRHAHSHAGVYGVLFPLTFAAWGLLGLETPGGPARTLYFLASAVAVAGFASAGYAGASIAASTVVGAVWLNQAWLGRTALFRQRGTLRLMPLVLLAGTLMVPPIALATARSPGLGQDLAHSFLAVLFLLAMVPAAVRRIGGRPLDPRVYVPAAALAAAHLGAAPSWPGRVGVAVTALTVAWAVWRSPAEARFLAGWAVFGIGGLALAAHPVPPHDLAVGGMHYLLLGPLLTSLVRAGPLPTWGALGAAAAMATALGPAKGMLGLELTQAGAGLAGAAWAAFGVWAVLDAAVGGRA